MQARYYDPVIGRFYSNDPVGFTNVHTFNRYAYANNNPYRYIDPNGESVLDVLDWGVDAVKLTSAVINGVGVPAAAADFAMSTVGLLSPVPGVGKGLKAASKALKVSSTKAPSLIKNKDWLDYTGEANSIIKGADVARKGGGKRAFVTDGEGKITKEITKDRTKVRRSNTSPKGTFEYREKIKPTPKEDLKILDKI